MDIEELAEKFENGSDVANEMNRRINTTVSGTVGLLGPFSMETFDKEVDISKGIGYRWYLMKHPNPINKRMWKVSVYLMNYDYGCLAYDSDRPTRPEDVKFVFEHRNYFLRGMIATFPGLEERIQSFIELANYFKEKTA
jgi:hypothetical protein